MEKQQIKVCFSPNNEQTPSKFIRHPVLETSLFSLGNNVFVEASGYIGVPKFCEEGIVDVELFRPVA